MPDPLSITTGVLALVGTALQTLLGFQAYKWQYDGADLMVASIRAQCACVATALQQIQDSISQNTYMSNWLQSDASIRQTFHLVTGACSTVFSILNERLQKLMGGEVDKHGRLKSNAKFKTVWNYQEMKELLSNIQGQASSLTLLLSALQTKSITEIHAKLGNQEAQHVFQTVEARATNLAGRLVPKKPSQVTNNMYFGMNTRNDSALQATNAASFATPLVAKKPDARKPDAGRQKTRPDSTSAEEAKARGLGAAFKRFSFRSHPVLQKDLALNPPIDTSLSSKKGRQEAFRALMSAVDLKDNHGVAVVLRRFQNASRSQELIQLLNKPPRYFRPPLCVAMERFGGLRYDQAEVSIVRLLLEAGARPDVRLDLNCKEPVWYGGSEWQSLLHYCAVRGATEIFSLLLSFGQDIEKYDEQGRTPLHCASQSRIDKMASYLLANGANLHARTRKGATPLHLAAEYGAIDVVILLVEAGAHLNSRDKLGYTPIMAAASSRCDAFCRETIVRFLLKRGAVVTNEDKGFRLGWSPEDKKRQETMMKEIEDAEEDNRTGKDLVALWLSTSKNRMRY